MDYWTECVASSFEEHGIEATSEQIEAVAGDIKVSHENYGLAHGHDAIPNPLLAEIEKRDREIERVASERDRVELDFKKNVAMRRRCDVTDVVLEGNGHATVYRR